MFKNWSIVIATVHLGETREKPSSCTINLKSFKTKACNSLDVSCIAQSFSMATIDSSMWGQHRETLDTGVMALRKMTQESRQQQQFQRVHSDGFQSSPSVWITAAFPVKGASRLLSTAKWRNDTCLIHFHHVHELNVAVIKQTVKKRKLDEVILCLWTELWTFAALSLS